jgi:hypothetical protein
METRQSFGHRHHRFAHRYRNCVDPFPRRSGPNLIPEAQTLVIRLSSEPDVTLTGAFAQTEGLIETTDLAL